MNKGTEDEPPDLSILIRHAEQALSLKARDTGTADYRPLEQLASALRESATEDKIAQRALAYVREINSLASAYNSRDVCTPRELTKALDGLAGELENPNLTPDRAGQLAVILGEAYKQR